MRFGDFHFAVFCYSRSKSTGRGTAMSFAMYILVGIIGVAAIYFIIKGKKS